MKILIVMAGDGKRFVDAGYKTIKPLIEVKNKTILEWTTRSLPFIKHYGESTVNINYELAFAIRTEHEKIYNLSNKLKEIYGNDIKINKFQKITRGNLETAYISIKNLFSDSNDELLILDADNHYNGDKFLFYKNCFKESCKKDFGAICCFYPKNKDSKWCFAKLDKNNHVSSLEEKHFSTNSYPMVGVFYFNRVSLFLQIAKEIIDSKQTVKNEFYLSQVFQIMLKRNIPICGVMVNKVVPLGTPEDVTVYGKFLI